jgi:hypothetical protein
MQDPIPHVAMFTWCAHDMRIRYVIFALVVYLLPEVFENFQHDE